jgi:Tol biopolymer transport system component
MPTPVFDIIALVGLLVVGQPAPLLPGVIDTADTEVRPAFSPDGRCVLWGSIGAPKTGWRILQTCREGGAWSKPGPVSFDGPDNDFDPAFSPDGRTVYFFSNRAGGLGGDDLYAVDRAPATGTYGAPRNLGPRFNTPGDEWAPAPTADGRLIFSSDGHGGAGKQDLFEAELVGDGPVQSLGPQINGPLDDFDAALLHDGRTLVFASGDLKAGTRVVLRMARRDDRGAFGPVRDLPAPVNCSVAINNGPAVDPLNPGVFYYSAHCPTLGPGRMDVFEVPSPAP